MRPVRPVFTKVWRFGRVAALLVLMPISLALLACAIAVAVRNGAAKWDIISGTRVAGDDTDSTVHIAQLQSANGRLGIFAAGEQWRVGMPALEQRYWNQGWVLEYWNGELDETKPDGGMCTQHGMSSAGAKAATTVASVKTDATAAADNASFAWHGFGYHADSRKVGPNDRWVRRLWLPHWGAGVIGAIVPAIWFFRRARRKSRVERGLCGECAYDLRASHDRCPRCGTRFKHDLFHTDAPAAAVDAA